MTSYREFQNGAIGIGYHIAVTSDCNGLKYANRGEKGPKTAIFLRHYDVISPDDAILIIGSPILVEREPINSPLCVRPSVRASDYI